ncbi:MAG TPA: sigma factor-like helix-turn-helix DNA-binding protein [Enterovirga sp.]
MTTLKEFEDALKDRGMHMALAILGKLRERDRGKRSVAPARRVVGRKMTPEVAREILHLHATTEMTQQEIAFRLGINQGRVNEVIKRGKWLTGDPAAPEAVSRDKALARMARGQPRAAPKLHAATGRRAASAAASRRTKQGAQDQLALGDL